MKAAVSTGGKPHATTHMFPSVADKRLFAIHLSYPQMCPPINDEMAPRKI